MDKSCWDIHKDNIYQDVRGSLSGHSKKGDYEKHEYAFDVMSVDFPSVVSDDFETDYFYGPNRVYRELKEYSISDNIFYNCEYEGGYKSGTPSAFVLKGNESNVYIDNRYIYCHTYKKNVCYSANI